MSLYASNRTRIRDRSAWTASENGKTTFCDEKIIASKSFPQKNKEKKLRVSGALVVHTGFSGGSVTVPFLAPLKPSLKPLGREIIHPIDYTVPFHLMK